MSMPISDEEWRQKLTPERYHILREQGTETPGTGTLLHNEETGEYKCAACGNVVFKSDTKYDSTEPGLVGWPSFSAAADNNAVVLKPDNSLGMERTEVTCAVCGSHLGHVFPANDSPSGQHYCINSAALTFDKTTG